MSFVRFRLKFRIQTLFPTLNRQFVVGVEVPFKTDLNLMILYEEMPYFQYTNVINKMRQSVRNISCHFSFSTVNSLQTEVNISQIFALPRHKNFSQQITLIIYR